MKQRQCNFPWWRGEHMCAALDKYYLLIMHYHQYLKQEATLLT